MRRVIIGENDEGKSVFLEDAQTKRNVVFDNEPEKWTLMSEIWATDDTPELPVSAEDPCLIMKSFVPSPKGTRFRVLYFPSEKQMKKLSQIQAEKGRDFFEEFHRQAPGFQDHMDNKTGMHITNTIDYGVIISGKIDLELDNGQKTTLKAGESALFLS